MPNWCSCELEITGKEAELKRFKNFAMTKKTSDVDEDNLGKEDRDYVLDTNKFIPYPKKFTEQDEKCNRYRNLKNKKKLTIKEKKELMMMELKPQNYENDGYNNGGYGWCNLNWGTKWGICHEELYEESKEHLNYHFDCAWSPCYPVIVKMSELFPELNFEMSYDEESYAFEGEYECKAGEVICDEQREGTPPEDEEEEEE